MYALDLRNKGITAGHFGFGVCKGLGNRVTSEKRPMDFNAEDRKSVV